MKAKRWTALLPLVVVLLLMTVGCYYLPSGTQRPAKASLSLTQALPANISSVVLVVSGPGMKTMANEYPVGTTSATLEVPAGPARTFTLLANTPSVTLKGEATVDLVAGESKEITLSPVAADSQIIVPDYLNYRLVQISDMAGTGWTAIIYSNLGIPAMTSPNQFAPYDVDFDSQGRIYVANYYDGVVRLDDIYDTSAEWLVRGAVTAVGAEAIAVDRAIQTLYYAKGSSLNRVVIEPLGTPAPLTGYTATYITGLAVGPDGSLYMTNYNYGNGGSLIKFDPQSLTETSYSDGSNWDPWDVSVQGGYVYTTHMLSSGVYKIARSGLDLKFIDEYTGLISDPFYGPRRFLAILSKRITFIDDAPFPANSDRLVSMDSVNGAGLRMYGSYGSGQDQFRFYEAC